MEACSKRRPTASWASNSCWTRRKTSARSRWAESGWRGIVGSRVAGRCAETGETEAVCGATGGLERCGSLGNGGKECLGFKGMRVGVLGGLRGA